MSNSIYVNAGASITSDRPYVLIATRISPEHEKNVDKVIDTLPISKRLHVIKRLPLFHYLQIIEIVRLINKNTSPKAITSYMEVINEGDFYMMGHTIACIKGIRRLCRCFDPDESISLRTSFNLGRLNIEGVTYERGVGDLSPSMLIAISLSKIIREEKSKSSSLFV